MKTSKYFLITLAGVITATLLFLIVKLVIFINAYLFLHPNEINFLGLNKAEILDVYLLKKNPVVDFYYYPDFFIKTDGEGRKFASKDEAIHDKRVEESTTWELNIQAKSLFGFWQKIHFKNGIVVKQDVHRDGILFFQSDTTLKSQFDK